VAHARSIPGVVVRSDAKGREAARFGMTASGHASLYSTAGRLLFNGGITGGRGHVGDNPGRSALVSILSNISPVASPTPVFGCGLGGLS
jgi:hypothetical protein